MRQKIALPGVVNKLFVFKSLLTMPSNVLLLHLKQTFPPIIWIFTEGKGDGIISRLPFEIFSTLTNTQYRKINDFILLSLDSFVHFLQIFAISFPIFLFSREKNWIRIWCTQKKIARQKVCENFLAGNQVLKN